MDAGIDGEFIEYFRIKARRLRDRSLMLYYAFCCSGIIDLKSSFFDLRKLINIKT